MNRPFIHINCASTMDGKISRPDGSRLRISGPWDMERVHKLRSDLGAVLVGAGTVIMDDPKLTVKSEYVPDPPRLKKIIIDGKGRIPVSSRFIRTEGRSILVTSKECDGEWFDRMNMMIKDEGVDMELLQLHSLDTDLDLVDVMGALSEKNISGLLVEGGSTVIWNLIGAGLYDKFTIYFGPMLIGGSGPTIMGGSGSLSPFPINIKNIKRTPDSGFLVEMVKDRQ